MTAASLGLALELVDEVNAGTDISKLVRGGQPTHRDLERYREAVALIVTANRERADPYRALLLEDQALEVIGRVFRRDDAVSCLYEAEQRGAEPGVESLSEPAADMVAGVWAKRAEIDQVLETASRRWKVDRMPPVDRSILRLGVWELLSSDETPVPVIISEAVRIAKEYSTGRSGSFVNGILGNVASAVRSDD